MLPTVNLEQLERVAIGQALALHSGNRTHAARAMGISTRTLQRKLQRYGQPAAGACAGSTKQGEK